MYLWGTSFLPLSLRSVVRSHGCATLCFEVAHPCSLYRWTLGWRSPTEQGLSQHPPRVESEGGFLLREKAPHTPKETASYQSTANYIVVIE